VKCSYCTRFSHLRETPIKAQVAPTTRIKIVLKLFHTNWTGILTGLTAASVRPVHFHLSVGTQPVRPLISRVGEVTVMMMITATANSVWENCVVYIERCACLQYFLLDPLLGSLLPYWSTGLINQFIDLSQAVGLLGGVIISSQGHYLNTGQHKHRKRRHIKHPFSRRDSNPQSRPPSGRRLFKLPRPAVYT
jgi:hypothetical protein